MTSKLRLAKQASLGIGTLSLIALQAILPIDLSLSSSFSLAPANAQSVRYTPPKRPGFKRSDGTGSRGEALRICGKRTVASLMPLAPIDHTGETISARPTFFWYLSTSQTVEVKLMEPGIRKPIFITTVQVDKPGIVQLELPKTAPELLPEKIYRWSLAVLCEDGSKDALALASIRRVTPAPALKKQLAIAKSDQSLAQVYAAQGLWYDALKTLSKAAVGSPHYDSFLSLLDQAGFTEITAQERKKLRR